MLMRRKSGGALTRPEKCRKKFLTQFPGGFNDETYLEWERNYKWNAHVMWELALNYTAFQELLRDEKFSDIAAHAVRIESRTNLLFSFEKMALRDAVRSPEGAKAFATGLYHFLHGAGNDETRFNLWRDVVAKLPRVQTRVLTWPVLTVFGFIAQPDRHVFLKPNVTREAAKEYGFEFDYHSKPSWATYESLIAFAQTVMRDQRDLDPKDLIDAQGFIWVQGSDEY
jgi:hypothetical protein